MDKMMKRLIQCFYTFGISSDSINSPDLFKNNELNEEVIKAEMVNKFPPGYHVHEIDPNVILSHCFPHGFKIIKSDQQPKEEFFHFKIDNVPAKILNINNVYFTCYLIYNNLNEYLNIQKKSRAKNGPTYFVPRILCLSSFIPFPYEFKYILTKIKNLSPAILGILKKPLEKVIESIVMTIPCPIRGIFNTELNKDYFLNHEEKNDFLIELKDINKSNIHSYLYTIIYKLQPDVILEIFKCITLEIPVIFFSTDKEVLTETVLSFLELLYPFVYQYPNIAILPKSNYGIIEYAKSFVLGINESYIDEKSGQNFFDKYHILLFNKPIRIVDLDKKVIDQYINQREESSIINFDGINEKKGKNTTENNNYFVDQNDVKPNYLSIQLPPHSTEKLKAKIVTFQKALVTKKKDLTSVFDKEKNEKIGEDQFGYYFSSILQTYNAFVFSTEKEVEQVVRLLRSKRIHEIQIEEIFKANDFCNGAKKEERDYLHLFIKTEMFKEFLKRKYLNEEKDRLEILYFDESIAYKKDKGFKLFHKKTELNFYGKERNKGKGLFETYQLYRMDKSKIPNDFDDHEKKMFQKKTDKLTNYYQLISNNNLCIYVIFPKLLYDDKFFERPFKEYDYFCDKNAEFAQIYNKGQRIENYLANENLFNIYKTEFVQFKNNPANNKISLTDVEKSQRLLWIKNFCMVYHYLDQNEKNLRFYEVLNIVRQNKKIGDEYLSAILYTFYKYGDYFTVFEFFNYLKYFCYGDYAYFVDKLATDNRKKNQNLTLKHLSISNSGYVIDYYKNIKDEVFLAPELDLHIRTRVFDENNNNVMKVNNDINEVIIFQSKIDCPKCHAELDITKISMNFSNMGKNENLKCYKCKIEFALKIDTQVGEKKVPITLYGLYYMNEVLASEIMYNYGYELDPEVLKEKYPSYLYSVIWFSFVKGINFDLLLKYKKGENKKILAEIEKQKEAEALKKKRKAKFVALQITKEN